MTTALLDKITMVVPTYNRPGYLDRLLEMYAPFDLKIIIADNSPLKHQSKYFKNPNRIYLYTPELDSFTKVRRVLNEITTEYVILCADDDFIFINGLLTAIAFLDNHQDYVCAQGAWIRYIYAYEARQIDYDIFRYSKYSLGDHNRMSIHGNTVQERFQAFGKPYRYYNYSVVRTRSLQFVFETLNMYLDDISDITTSEACYATAMITQGKVKELDLLFHLREHVLTQGSNVYVKGTSIEQSKEMAKKCVKKILLHIGYENQEAIVLSDTILDNYFHGLDLEPEYSRFRPLLFVSPNRKTSDVEIAYLEQLYKKEPYLKDLERIIRNHHINSGYLVAGDPEKMQIASNLNLFYENITTLFSQFEERGIKIVVYGAGTAANIIGAMFPNQVAFFVDINTKLHGTKINNLPVYDTGQLAEKSDQYDVILISVMGRASEIEPYIHQILTVDKEIIEL